MKECPFCDNPDSSCHINEDDRWISVKESLPNRGEFVLIKLNKNNYLFPMDVSFRLVDGEYPAWGNTSQGARWYKEDQVTHWMPLPKTPEKKDE
jgi:hypothetical protein